MNQDLRLQQLIAWIGQRPELGIDPESLTPASSDASFRRYFRGRTAAGGSIILMDAPPDKEDSRPFVHASEVFSASGVSVPRIFAQDLAQGYLALEDFGDTQYLQRLPEDSSGVLYKDALQALIQMQLASRPGVFAQYDRAMLRRELDLFPRWYIQEHRKVSLSAEHIQTMDRAFERIIDLCVAQPSVFVHRDYHSRNLMVLEAGRNPGIIDFQDAVYGPITYDLASLLRDAYIVWEEAQQIDWLIRYWEMARRAKLPIEEDFGQFYRDFEWMGLQRHIKVLGIFARLNYRDGKARYLADLPVVMNYTMKVLQRYRELGPLQQVFEAIEQHTPEVGYTF